MMALCKELINIKVVNKLCVIFTCPIALINKNEIYDILYYVFFFCKEYHLHVHFVKIILMLNRLRAFINDFKFSNPPNN